MLEDLVIIGADNLGSKSNLFLNRAKTLQKWFSLPETNFLAFDFVESIFNNNDLSMYVDYSNEELIKIRERFETAYLALTQSQLNSLESVLDYLPSDLFAFRSSGNGDADGNGVYDTAFLFKNDIYRAITKVLSSYFSQDAVLFREKNIFGKGIGVMIQPLVGNYFYDGLIFAPQLSGSVFYSDKKGYFVKIAPGFAGDKFYSTFEIKESDIDCLTKNNDLNEDLFVFFNKFHLKNGVSSSCINLSDSSSLSMINSNLTEVLLDDLLKSLSVTYSDFKSFFKNVHKLESEFGEPQYMEFAVSLEDKIKFYALQTADISLDKSFITLPEENIFLKGNEANHTKIATAKQIVYLSSNSNIEDLIEFNKQNKNYILLFDSYFLKSVSCQRIHLHHFSNASAALMNQTYSRSKSVEDHFGNELKKYNLPLANLEPYTLSNYIPLFTKHDSLYILEGNFKIFSEAKRETLVITKKD